MSLSVHSVTFNCADAESIAKFWSQALGRPLDTEPAPAPFFASIGRQDAPSGQPVMMFIQVPETKSIKNRMHLDLEADDPHVEVARLVALGASVHSEHDEWGVRWTTLTDPEGNEFCVARH